MARDFELGSHLLLIGNQGVGLFNSFLTTKNFAFREEQNYRSIFGTYPTP